MPTKQEIDRAVKIIENSPLNPQEKITKLYRIIEEKEHRIVNLEMEKGENSSPDGKPDIICVIVWLGIGIFCGLILAGIIYMLTV
jgi:hypothetical protein